MEQNVEQQPVTKKKLSWRQINEGVAFGLGNLGHSAFYGALSTYFIVFVTSGMFSGVAPAIANRLIGLITGLVVVIRLAEVVVDPILGNIVDNTETRWGKFTPWQVIGSIVSSVLLVVIFSGIFGLAKVNWILFAIVFVILFIILDVFYSLTDVSYWGMVPAISEDSHARGIYTALGSFTGTIGWNGLTMVVVPITTYFTFMATGKHTQGPQGWLAFAIIVGIVAILSALCVAFGTSEKHNAIREAAKQKTTIKGVFMGIIKNDQIMWVSLGYLFYSLAYVTTNGVLFYLFKFVIGKPGEFWIAGAVATVIGFVTSPLYPILNRFIPRKVLFALGQCSMILAYIIFIVAHTNLTLLIIGLVLFNINFAQLVTVLSMTDAIEYGQLKNGNRNEAVVLAVRPMLDKITGAFSNGIVGAIALVAGMTGSATAADMTASNIHTFELLAFYLPLACAILSLLVFMFKVTITEKKHAEIVEELQTKLATGEVADAPATVATVDDALTTKVLAPVSGQPMMLEAVKNGNQGQGLPGVGFAIQPNDGRLYAPFDGTIRFTFSTKHTLGIVSDAGLETIIHVGLGTVNLRGAGFTTYYQDGQVVHAGDLLMTFDRDLIKQHGYDDVVVTFFTQPGRITARTDDWPATIQHGQSAMKVTLKPEPK
ncbi:PTS sugar transporter subunit IIA [Lactiplantibacillus pentosus]|uniref:PTS sugar transporter subunit IIA n=1 Tax=Lactiplantibacillus pentosus TaxID=1589 RepID=UPI000B547BAF|nr:PTS sugar transporter subunit IIA [Lactiplantibacillus pentosus]ASG80011.1 phosphotransferase enzyme IIA component [Lactiplantibacillus pentosus]MDC6396672.1 glycoside-pentoside-hexuronide (GPH):cation symporter [Lactiplantibacillus pentosus]MDO7803949.1 glycoside-pentoside-hexuronide (GPH):cation symporter [Lactiplantibacillus pentosus]